MKNLLRKALLLLCALMLAASMTACGSDKSEDTKDKTEDTAKDETEETDETDETEADDSSDGGVTEKFDTLDDFVKSDIMQEQLETQIAALEGTGISADVYADGDTLVYDFTIEDEAVASVMDKATLDSSLQSQASTFEGVAAMLPAAIENIENPAVVVRYLDPAGAEITSMEFTAN